VKQRRVPQPFRQALVATLRADRLIRDGKCLQGYDAIQEALKQFATGTAQTGRKPKRLHQAIERVADRLMRGCFRG
jgi:hypothetical protein